MPDKSSFPPHQYLSQAAARHFILASQNLWPPRQLAGKAGVLAFIGQVGSIQFDPINIVGRNPDLALQSRIADYRPAMLDELLYKQRALIDGWDKMASLYLASDWPHFTRARQAARENPDPRRPPETVLAQVLEEVHQRGPLSSLDFEQDQKVDWYWGPTQIMRAALEYLYNQRYLGVHHRVNNRRYFAPIEHLLPAQLLATPDPHADLNSYHDWHVLRRVNSMGLVQARSGEYWHGIHGLRSSQARQQVLTRLVMRGELSRVLIEDLPGEYYLSPARLAHGAHLAVDPAYPAQAALIAPLDNLIWDRDLIRKLFGFTYIWEVYKPPSQRQYGYYVLPVLYGDRFVARVEPRLDKKSRVLTIENWWWEPGIIADPAMAQALKKCLLAFARYLSASSLAVHPQLRQQPGLDWGELNLD